MKIFDSGLQKVYPGQNSNVREKHWVVSDRRYPAPKLPLAHAKLGLLGNPLGLNTLRSENPDDVGALLRTVTTAQQRLVDQFR